MNLNTISFPRFGQQVAPAVRQTQAAQSGPLPQPAADTVKFSGYFDVPEDKLEDTPANRKAQAENLMDTFPFDKWLDAQEAAAKEEAAQGGEEAENFPTLKKLFTPEKLAQFKTNMNAYLGHEVGDFSAQDLKEWAEAANSDHPKKVEKAFDLMFQVGSYFTPFDESDFGPN